MYQDPYEQKKNQPVEAKKKVQEKDDKDKKSTIAYPDYSHDVNCYLVKREKGQPGPGGYETVKPMGKYSDDSKNKTSAKPKTEDKDKAKKARKEDNFPGPGAYNILGEGKAREAEKQTAEKGKKDEKGKDKQLEYATYLSENLCLTNLAPGPGNYNPIDNCVWNKLAREANDKKNQGGGPKTKSGEDKKDKGDKKKQEKPLPGPGSYEVKSGFPEVEKKDSKKEKKEKDDKDTKKKDDHKIFGGKIAPVPGPGTYTIDRDMLKFHAKITQGRYNTATATFRRDIVTNTVLNTGSLRKL